jgi:hypothetical protein
MKQLLCLSLVLGGTMAASATDSQAMKAALAGQEASRSLLNSSNGQVTVNVTDAASSWPGRFTIGTATGEPLLYGHGAFDPQTSYIRILVDGVVYGPGTFVSGSYDVAILPSAGPALVGSSIVTSWLAGGVTLTQTLTPTVVGGQGTVRIEYDVVSDSSPHDVALLLEMDTQVDANDAAPISTSAGYTAVETCFETGFVPNIWQAFESAPDQGPEFLVGCGILNGFGATLPDRFAVGAWSAFYNASFNYACTGNPYGDSGVLLWWEAGILEAGESAHYQTYYGTCDVQTQPGNLSLSLGGNTELSCDNGQLTPNPFDVNLLVTNTGGDRCLDVQAIIIPGAGLTGGAPVNLGDLESGEVGAAGFQLTADGSICGTYLTYTIEVSSLTCPPNIIYGEILVPCCDEVAADDQPVAYGLGANYPNPFNPATTISFSMAETGQASLSVHNLAGETVATLWNGLAQRGTHEIVFDASALPSGLYLYTLTSAQGVQTRKMVLTK